jgi:hypothetical protein
MKRYLLINASPRRTGTSVVLAEMCREYLTEKGHTAELLHLQQGLKEPESLLRAVSACDTLVISGPCYVNTYPADVVTLLELLASRPEALHGQDLYGMIQGGMPYAHTHDSGLSMLACFAGDANVTYKGGFAMGFGALLNGQPVDKLPNAKKVRRQLAVFFGHMEKGETSPKVVYEAAQMHLPAFVCRLMTLGMNRHIDNDLRKHGIDPYQSSPYL